MILKCRGLVRYGQVCNGMDWAGEVRRGQAGGAWRGRARHVMARTGVAGIGRRGKYRTGWERNLPDRLGEARNGRAGEDWNGYVRQGLVPMGWARRGWAG